MLIPIEIYPPILINNSVDHRTSNIEYQKPIEKRMSLSEYIRRRLALQRQHVSYMHTLKMSKNHDQTLSANEVYTIAKHMQSTMQQLTDLATKFHQTNNIKVTILDPK
jgi:hypothetical protein